MRVETVIVAGFGLPKDRADAVEFSFLRDDDIPADIRHSATLNSLAAGPGESENERFPPGVEGYSRHAGVFSVHFDLAAEVTHTPDTVPSKGKPIPTLQHLGLTCLRVNREQYFPPAAGIANPEFGWSTLPLFPVSDGQVTPPATRAEPPRFSRSPQPFSCHPRRKNRRRSRLCGRVIRMIAGLASRRVREVVPFGRRRPGVALVIWRCDVRFVAAGLGAGFAAAPFVAGRRKFRGQGSRPAPAVLIPLRGRPVAAFVAKGRPTRGSRSGGRWPVCRLGRLRLPSFAAIGCGSTKPAIAANSARVRSVLLLFGIRRVGIGAIFSCRRFVVPILATRWSGPGGLRWRHRRLVPAVITIGRKPGRFVLLEPIHHIHEVRLPGLAGGRRDIRSWWTGTLSSPRVGNIGRCQGLGPGRNTNLGYPSKDAGQTAHQANGHHTERNAQSFQETAKGHWGRSSLGFPTHGLGRESPVEMIGAVFRDGRWPLATRSFPAEVFAASDSGALSSEDAAMGCCAASATLPRTVQLWETAPHRRCAALLR